MGQKVHPEGLRVGYIHDWKSTWFNDREFADYLLEDIQIRDHIETKLSHAGLSSITIRKDKNEVEVNIHTARPGIVIGKSGVEVDALRRELHRMTKKSVRVNILEIKRPELDARLVAQSIAEQLQNRVAFRRAMKRSLTSAMRSGAKGVRIQVSGRLGGSEMARTEFYSDGRVPLHTLRADIDYGFHEAAHHVRPHRREGLDQQGRDHALRLPAGPHPDGGAQAGRPGRARPGPWPPRRRQRWRPGSRRSFRRRQRWRPGSQRSSRRRRSTRRRWAGRKRRRAPASTARRRRRRAARAPGPRFPTAPPAGRWRLMLQPKRVKFRKQHRGRRAGFSKGGLDVEFGEYGLKALDRGWVTNRQIEAARIAMTRKIKRGGKVWINVFPDKPVTKKPAETRMGSGKGSPEAWVAVVKPGRVMFELAGVPEPLAREAMRLAGHKLPIRTKFVMREAGGQ